MSFIMIGHLIGFPTGSGGSNDAVHGVCARVPLSSSGNSRRGRTLKALFQASTNHKLSTRVFNNGDYKNLSPF